MLAESLGTVRDGELVKKKRIDVTGYFASEKFDGYRAVWTGDKFISRGGNTFEVPDWMKDLMPTEPLDGELFRGRCNYESCGVFRRKNATEEDWMNVKYMVFDLPAMDAPFEERMKALEALVEERCDCSVDVQVPEGIRTVGCPLVFATQTKMDDEAHVVRTFNDIVANGGEGIMLRKPGSQYTNRRTTDLLKLKAEDDTECKIIGYKDGTGNNTGLLGSYRCALLDDESKTFFVGSGLTNQQRRNPLNVGTIITITYNDKTKNGIPRHPRFLRVRNELNGGQRTEKAMRELAVLEEAYREPFLKTSTEGSTYQTEDGAFFVKFLTPRQLAYYNTNEPVIRQFHAPYRLVKDRLEMEAFGRPISKSNQKGIRFALQALETMHANQTFHGDVFSTDLGRSDVHVNVGNILQDDSGTFKLIDFGPLEGEHRNDAELLSTEKRLMATFKRMRGSERPTKRKPHQRRSFSPTMKPRLLF